MLVQHPKFHPEAMLSAPRRSAGIPNHDGTSILYSITSYSFGKHEQSSEIRVLDVKTFESSLLDDDKESSSPVWIDSKTIALLRATESETTELIIGNVENFKDR